MYPIDPGLPFTGVAIGWQLVLVATLVTVGGAVIRLAPRIRSRARSRHRATRQTAD